MLNKQSKPYRINTTININDKIMLLVKRVSVIFNDNTIGTIAKKVIESLEFKENSQIIADLSNLNDSTIVSTMINTIKKELQIEWSMENQNTFYNILVEIFKHNATDINVRLMNNNKRKGILVLGGSYNPCHTEHVELLHEIKCNLEQHENFIIVAAYLVVTTDAYVMNKLQNAAIKFEHRHKICELTASKYSWCHPSHIAMVSATQYSRMIRMRNSFDKYFGTNKLINELELKKLITINCCGADRISSSIISAYTSNMYSSSSTSWTACIARKGYTEDMKQVYDDAKTRGECNGFVYVNVECKPISSTLIRKHLLLLRDKLCNKIKDENGGGWKMKKRVNNKYKENFRNNVKEMLHSDAIEYLIDNIHALWIVPKGKVMGGGKPHNVITNSARKKKKIAGKKKKWWSFK